MGLYFISIVHYIFNMRFVVIVCFTIFYVTLVRGETKKPTKDQLNTFVKIVMDKINDGIKELDSAINEKATDEAHKKFYQEIKTHLQQLVPKKQAVLDKLNQDNNVDAAIESLKGILSEHQKEMERFHKEHPANKQ